MAALAAIQEFLEKEGIGYKLITLSEKAVSYDDVVRLAGGQIKMEEIVKTLIVKDKKGEFIACVLPGKERLNSEVMERLATRDEVKEIAGVDIGAVCPILLGIPVVLDARVSTLERVNMGSGDHLKGLEIGVEDLLKVLPEYRIEEITL